MTEKKSVSAREGWDTWNYNGPEGLVAVTYWTGAHKIDRAKFPHCARVLTPCAPDKASAEKAWALEDQLIAVLDHRNVPCLMVGTLRYGKTREIIFQVADWEPFRPAVGTWFQGNPGVELDVSEHEGWEFFDKHVWPDDASALFIADRNTIETLKKHGSDPAKPHDLEYLFQGPPAALANLEGPLKARGYRPLDAKAAPGQIVMVKTLPLVLEEVFKESQANDRLARNSACTCDGWGAHVVK